MFVSFWFILCFVSLHLASVRRSELIFSCKSLAIKSKSGWVKTNRTILLFSDKQQFASHFGVHTNPQQYDLLTSLYAPCTKSTNCCPASHATWTPGDFASLAALIVRYPRQIGSSFHVMPKTSWRACWRWIRRSDPPQLMPWDILGWIKHCRGGQVWCLASWSWCREQGSKT